MFQVKRFNGEGQLIETISSEQASKNSWKNCIKEAPTKRQPEELKERNCRWEECRETYQPTAKHQMFCCPEHRELKNGYQKKGYNYNQ